MKVIKKRFDLLKDKFLLNNLPANIDTSCLSKLIEEIWNNLNKSTLKSREQKIIFLWLTVLAMYPSQREIISSELYLFNNDFTGLETYFKDNSFFNHNNLGAYEILLSFPPPGTLILDVSHTADYPYTSGIQRVVRKLSQNLLNQNHSLLFIHFVKHFGTMIPLEESKKNELRGNQSQANPTEITKIEVRYKKIKNILGERLSWKVAVFKSSMKKVLTLSSVRFLLNSVINYLLVKLGLREKKGILMPVLFQSQILIPEIVQDSERLDVWISILKYLENKSSMILYDFIPIYHPEYCVVIREFVSYTRLLRYIDQVSCISDSVAEDCRNFMKNIPRTKPIKIETHYLGADLNQLNYKQQLPKELDNLNKPMVLCVGTFEPRKNQITVARAAIKLMKEGHQFKLVFFGNPGWLNIEIIGALVTWKKMGYDIVTVGSGSDGLLDTLYKMSKFTVFCSLTEGFGLPIVESRFYGKPCLVSNIGSMIEVGNKIGGCYSANPESIESIAEGIKQLLYSEKVEPKSDWITWGQYSMNIHGFAKNI